jgi:tetratricopeptide (TPR) repeat protein
MVTAQEILTFLRSLGIDSGVLGGFLASKAGDIVYEKTLGAGRAAVTSLVKKFRAWRDHDALLIELNNSKSDEEREALVRRHLEAWIHANATDAAEAAYQLYRILYLRALRAYCSKIAMVSDLGTEPLSIEKVWVPQTFQLQPSGSSASGEIKRLQHDDLGEAIRSTGSLLLLEGGAGSGKSTQLRKLVLDHTSRLLAFEEIDEILASPLPVYASASDLLKEKTNLSTSLHAAIGNSLGLYLPFPMPSDFFDQRNGARPKSLILLVDGLDEVDALQRDYLINALRHAAEEAPADYTVVLASRPLDHRQMPSLETFARLKLAELSELQASKLVTKLLNKEDAVGILAQRPHLMRNPMLLTLASLLQVDQSVSSKAVLYQEFLASLLKRRRAVNQLFGDSGAINSLLSFAAEHTEPIQVGDLMPTASELRLVPNSGSDLARRVALERLLEATGLFVKVGTGVKFIHHSFKDYILAENLAKRFGPSVTIWNELSPFRLGWETVSFIAEIWLRDGKLPKDALESLLGFGEQGLRVLSSIASRSKDLPASIVRSSIAKWTYREDDFWQGGFLDGPIQQLTLIASNYEEAKEALRQIARDSWTFAEDAVYAAEGLGKIGCREEAIAFLINLCRDEEVYSSERVLSAQKLFDFGEVGAARDCLMLLYSEWKQNPPDMELSSIYLAELLHKIGEEKLARSLLRSLSRTLGDDLCLRVLAETYADLGYSHEAMRLAKRLFKGEQWLKDPFSSKHEALELAALFERLGNIRNAEVIRRKVGHFGTIETELLRGTASNPHQAAQKRIDAAKELIRRRQVDVGLNALYSIAANRWAQHYDRISAINGMLAEEGGRCRAIQLLKTIAEDESYQKVWCGTALVQAGEVELGWFLLRNVALDPGEEASRRVDAISELATVGRIDIAAAGFRRLSAANELTAGYLSTLGKAFCHTSFWQEFLAHCEKILEKGDTSLRLSALDVLKTTSHFRSGQVSAERLLFAILRNKGITPSDRIRAARELADLYDWEESEFLLSMMSDPGESLEAGLAALSATYFNDSFMALDGGLDVVWDKKLSLDQFIRAAHEFLRIYDFVREREDGGVWTPAKERICEALLDIATDCRAPIERRLLACGVPIESNPYADTHVLWGALRAFVDDNSTPLTDKLFAIKYALKHQADLFKDCVERLESSSIEKSQLAEITRTEAHRNAAITELRARLSDVTEAKVRLRIISELERLEDKEFCTEQATSLLEHELSLPNPNDTVTTEAFSMICTRLDSTKLLELTLATTASNSLSGYQIVKPLEIFIELGRTDLVARVLASRVRETEKLSGEVGKFYELLYLRQLQSRFDSHEDAKRGLLEIAGDGQRSIERRIAACGRLASIGEGREARKCLRRIVNVVHEPEDRLSCGKVAIEIQDHALARNVLASIANVGDPWQRLEVAEYLARSGLSGMARRILRELWSILPESLWQAVPALISAGMADHALTLCRNCARSSLADSLDVVDVIEGIPEEQFGADAHLLLLDVIANDAVNLSYKARAAEGLYSLKHAPEARTILFEIATAVDADTSIDALSLISIAESMHSCDLPWSARGILSRINEDALDSDELERLQELREGLSTHSEWN